jgi:hypothetical protein
MGILDRVKTAVAEALAPARAGESKELAYLREIYYNKDTNIRRNQFYRLLNQNGNHVGFSFSCVCGAEYQMLDVTDWLGRQNVCPTCKTQFDLMKTVGLTQETPAGQVYSRTIRKVKCHPDKGTTRGGPPNVTSESQNMMQNM